MTDEELAERVLGYLEEGLTRLVKGPNARPHLEAFLRGEVTVFVSRAEAGFGYPPDDLRTDIGTDN